ncbi:MAG: secretin N-terminal domain-containing protein [Rhodospirillaceae bacterium]|nr:secretin N-terminal domain-containing protein [Rhodospirillaceae bacterium]
MTTPQQFLTGSAAQERRTFRRALMIGAGMAPLFAGCETPGPLPFPEALKIEKRESANQPGLMLEPDTAGRRDKLTQEPLISTPLGRTIAEPLSSSAPPKLTGEKLSVNFEGIRLPAFVNTVFGEMLNVTFEIDSAIQKREQLVTLRTAESLDPNQFLRLTQQVLSNYGIAVVYQNDVFRIVDSATLQQDIPRIIRSRSLPSISDDMRPIFYYVPLTAISAGLMQQWLSQSLKDRLQYQTLPLANGLLLLGKRDDVQAAQETIAVLDQPALAGARSRRISPAFWSADKFATQLQEVLTAEGYQVTVGGNANSSIKIVPIRALNILIIFCPDEAVIDHVVTWAEELDKPGQTIDTKGIFYHPVFNTKASDIAAIIGQFLGAPASAGGALASSQMTTPQTLGAGGAVADQRSTTTPTASAGIVVDEGRNALIFQGTAEEYAQLRVLVEQMDRAPLEVLIEATVAEVTLKQGESLGLVLNFDDGAAAAASRSTIKSDSGLLINLIRDRGQFNANIKALADKSRVNILSTPRVVASSGKAASINIGTQVPIITTQQTSPLGQVGGTSALLQDIQYRNTGVNLIINPTINSNRRVELQIQQEVSEAQVNNVSSVQSPLILTRSINTSLSLDDAETVLLGGLISENISNSENGIPYLKDIPMLGNLFKSTSTGRNRTELIVLLTPYIIESAETSRAIRDAFRDKLTAFKPEQDSTMPAPQ